MATIEPFLLRNGKNVGRDPVDQKTRRERRHDEHHHPRHDRENLLLGGVHLGRVEPELQKHGETEQEREHADAQESWRIEVEQAEQVQNVQRIRRRQILDPKDEGLVRSEEHTSELQSLMRISYAVFCLKKKKKNNNEKKPELPEYDSRP